MAVRSADAGLSRCCWPTNPSSVRGRIRAARGRSAAGGAVGGGSSGTSNSRPIALSMRLVPAVPLATVAREWGRIGVLGFGGPPAHVALLRDLTVERRRWIEAREFEDAFAVCSLLPGPASTQMAIYTAQRVGGRAGALVGGLAFILPGLALILVIAAVALSDEPPELVVGFGAGAAAAVVAVVVQAGLRLTRIPNARAAVYVAAGVLGAAFTGAAVVGVLLLCGLAELAYRTQRDVASAVWPALVWMAFKVGALS